MQPPAHGGLREADRHAEVQRLEGVNEGIGAELSRAPLPAGGQEHKR